jgi:hypothetical protein
MDFFGMFALIPYATSGFFLFIIRVIKKTESMSGTKDTLSVTVKNPRKRRVIFSFFLFLCTTAV